MSIASHKHLDLTSKKVGLLSELVYYICIGTCNAGNAVLLYSTGKIEFMCYSILASTTNKFCMFPPPPSVLCTDIQSNKIIYEYCTLYLLVTAVETTGISHQALDQYYDVLLHTSAQIIDSRLLLLYYLCTNQTNALFNYFRVQKSNYT